MEKSKKKFKWWILILCAVLLAVILFLLACIGPFFEHRGKVGPNVYYAFNQNTGTVIVYGKGCTYAYMPFDAYWTSPDDTNDDTTYTDSCGFDHVFPGGSIYIASPLMLEAENATLRKVIVLPGVTGLDSGFLRDCYDLETVYLPGTLEYFDDFAIAWMYSNDDHEDTDVTIYFDGNPPFICSTDNDNRYPPLFGHYNVTIVHRPNASGWDGAPWDIDNADEFYEAMESRNFHINWLPLF